MGNDKYQHVPQLKKAVNDANAMERELRSAGFEVTKHVNLTDRAQEQAVSVFSKSVRGGDEVVLFFAGHGVQIKSGSYLLPVDIQVSSEREVEKFALGLQDMMDIIAAARPTFAMFIIDACRNNPIAKTGGRSVGIERGLIPTEPAKGQIVVYSAGKGQTALDRLSDSDADPNGVFTREFIKRMRRPGTGIRDLIEEVQDSVEKLARTVGHNQRPAVYSEARGNFYFLGPVTLQTTPSTSVSLSAPQEEINFWNESKAVGNVDGYQAYLDQYPKGRYAGIARAYIKQLKPDSETIAVPSPQLKANPTTPPDTVSGAKVADQVGGAKSSSPSVSSQSMFTPATLATPAGTKIMPDTASLRSLSELVTAQSSTTPDVPTDRTRSGLPYLAGAVTPKVRKAAQGKQIEQLFVAYQQDAEKGDPVAQTSLGNMYDTGLGTERKPDLAAVWFRKAADQGYARGESNLGVMFALGRGIEKDVKEAVKWYRVAANKGHAEAQGRLGFMYAEGSGVVKSDAEAVQWYRKSAEQGNSFGQNQLGFVYREGLGITRNDVEAVTWFRKSAEQGNAAGQSNLGFMYNNGRGVFRDYDEALKWFRKSAEQGYAQGKANLGFMYENGRGVAKNETEAKGWYQQAADQGNDFAKAQLQKLSTK